MRKLVSCFIVLSVFHEFKNLHCSVIKSIVNLTTDTRLVLNVYCVLFTSAKSTRFTEDKSSGLHDEAAGAGAAAGLQAAPQISRDKRQKKVILLLGHFSFGSVMSWNK